MRIYKKMILNGQNQNTFENIKTKIISKIVKWEK